MLQGKTAVITGARRGIGKKTVEIFAKNGADIFACARTQDEGFERELEILAQENDVRIFPVYFDVADEAAIKEGIKLIRKQSKQIDILVNLAGVADASTSFQMSSIEKMKHVFDVNFWGTTLMTQYISRLMSRNHSGSIVQIASVAALDGVPAQYEYAASKAAILGGVRQLAHELWQYGIRVNAIAPGVCDTDMGDQIEKSLKERVLENTIMKRAGKPEEIANVIAFLGSDLSSYMTGQIIRVDGGI